MAKDPHVSKANTSIRFLWHQEVAATSLHSSACPTHRELPAHSTAGAAMPVGLVSLCAHVVQGPLTPGHFKNKSRCSGLWLLLGEKKGPLGQTQCRVLSADHEHQLPATHPWGHLRLCELQGASYNGLFPEIVTTITAQLGYTHQSPWAPGPQRWPVGHASQPQSHRRRW